MKNNYISYYISSNAISFSFSSDARITLEGLMIMIAATLTKTSSAIGRNYNQPAFSPKIEKIAVTTRRRRRRPVLRVSQTAAQSSRDFITFFLREPAAHTYRNQQIYVRRERCAARALCGAENVECAAGGLTVGNIRDFLSEGRLQCKWNGEGGGGGGRGGKRIVSKIDSGEI